MTIDEQVTPENNPLAIASLVAGLIAWVVGALGSCAFTFLFPPVSICTAILFLVGSIVAAITGHMGRNQIRAGGGAEGGEGLATTGLVLGWAGVGLNLLLVCVAVVGVIALALLGPSIGNVFSNIILELEAQQ